MLSGGVPMAAFCRLLLSALLVGSSVAFTHTRGCRLASPTRRTSSCSAARRRIAMTASEGEATTKRVVMKFGGSSLASAERIEQVASIVEQTKADGSQPAVVVSAMGKTTNMIVAAADKAWKGEGVDVSEIRAFHLDTIDALGNVPASVSMEVRSLLRDLESLLDGVSMVKELSPRTADLVVSFGERMSCRLVAAALNSRGIEAAAYDSWTLGLRTKGGFGEAVVDESCFADIRSSFDSIGGQEVAVVTGFIGHDAEGRVTTLGRGGSDLTATSLAAAGGFDEVQVWKDVDGMMTADPRVVQGAKPVPFVTYEEAAELAYFGAQVLHPISMQPAQKFGVPVRVKNSYNPTHPGSLIASTKPQCSDLVTAITSKRRVTLVDIVSSRSLGSHGFLAKVFDIFARDSVSVDVVATSEVSVSLSLDKTCELSQNALTELERFAQVDIKRDRSIVSFIADVKRSTQLIAKVFGVLALNDIQVEMISQGASKVNVALVVHDNHAIDCVNLVHSCFFGESPSREQLPQNDDKSTTSANSAPSRPKEAAAAASS